MQGEKSRHATTAGLVNRKSMAKTGNGCDMLCSLKKWYHKNPIETYFGLFFSLNINCIFYILLKFLKFLF